VFYDMPAVAMTDHGNMYGAFLFWQAIDKHNKSVKDNNAAITKGEKEGRFTKRIKMHHWLRIIYL
jgi:DNA polymerase III alpha subunit